MKDTIWRRLDSRSHLLFVYKWAYQRMAKIQFKINSFYITFTVNQIRFKYFIASRDSLSDGRAEMVGTRIFKNRRGEIVVTGEILSIFPIFAY